MKWRFVEVPDTDATKDDLDDFELIGMSILMLHNAGEPRDLVNVYWRAWMKIQSAVEVAKQRAWA